MRKAWYISALSLVLAACGGVQAEDDTDPDPAPTPTRYGVSVRQHEALPQLLTGARVDEILAEMSALAQVSDSDGDVACSVEFVRHGDVGTFGNDEIPFSISSRADFSRIGTVPGSVKVVGEINWCGALGAGIIGCASTPGPALSVVRFLPVQEAILWEHEFAHTTGSPHRDVVRQIMRPVILLDMREIDQGECDRILNTAFVVHADPDAAGTMAATRGAALIQAAGDGSPMAAMAAALPQGPPATAMIQSASADVASGPPEPVTEFVSKTYFEGVPFNEASRYTNEDVPELAAVLDDPAQNQAWGNAIATLGAIGTEPAKRELLDFLMENPSGRLSAAEYIAKSNVPVALGWLVHQSGDQEALELLLQATNGGWWAEEAGIAWTTPIHEDREALIASLVTKAIIGLTLTGTEEARIRLDQLSSRLDPRGPSAALSQDEAASLDALSPDARTSVFAVSPVTRDAVAQSGGESFLEGQIQEFEALSAQGLEGYYAQ